MSIEIIQLLVMLVMYYYEQFNEYNSVSSLSVSIFKQDLPETLKRDLFYFVAKKISNILKGPDEKM